jgi:Skp family chaperone for outer membrane proteins
VAVCLLSLATGLVLVALPAQSSVWLSIASVLSLCCGWAAARIVYSELVQSRREAAADRAEQAEAYRSMFAERASEHAEFTTAMTDRLVRRDRELFEIRSALVAAKGRAAEAESRVQREARRANDAVQRVQALTRRVGELEEALAIRHAEEVDELASWGEGLSVHA